MKYADNDVKFTCIVNARAPVPAALNAVAHLMLGLGGTLPKEAVALLDYPLADFDPCSRISRYPVIILQAKNSSQLRSTFDQALAGGAKANLFTQTMIGTSAAGQQAATRATTLAEAEIVALALAGESGILDPLTRRYSLYRVTTPVMEAAHAS